MTMMMMLMMRIFTLLALTVQITLAFHPVTPRFGITTTTRITATLDASFEGIDLEKLLGTKKYKKTMKKLQRNANNRRANGNNNSDLASNENLKETTASSTTTTQLKATTTEVAGTASGRAGLKLLICGAPAAGKGTQCAFIKEKFGVVHLSTGDMLRAAVAAETEVGKMAKDFMDSGKLVPDEVIIGIVKDRLEEEDCKSNGWLLDGFPRTQAQAQALADAGISGDCFIMLNVPNEVLVERVVGRRTDPETGDIYHMTFSPPSDPNVLARLVQRSDDTEEKVMVRLEQYHANVEAVKGSYNDIIVEIDGLGKPEEVFKAIESAVVAKLSV